MMGTAPAAPLAGTAILGRMVHRKPSFLRVVITGDVAQLVTPSARFAAYRQGDEYDGEWITLGDDLPEGWSDAFTADEAKLLLPFLRARVNAGRAARSATTPDGRLIVRAKKTLNMTAAQIGAAIGVHESVISRAMNGALPAAHRDALQTLLRERANAPPRTK